MNPGRTASQPSLFTAGNPGRGARDQRSPSTGTRAARSELRPRLLPTAASSARPRAAPPTGGRPRGGTPPAARRGAVTPATPSTAEPPRHVLPCGRPSAGQKHRPQALRLGRGGRFHSFGGNKRGEVRTSHTKQG